jgi:hypothetical protein
MSREKHNLLSWVSLLLLFTSFLSLSAKLLADFLLGVLQAATGRHTIYHGMEDWFWQGKGELMLF